MQNCVRDCLEKLEIVIFHKTDVTDAMTRVDETETGTVINVVEHKSSFSEFEKYARQDEKIVTHEQKEVDKVVTHAHSVGGVLWRHFSHVAKRRSRMAKQFHSCPHDMRTVAFVTVNLSVKPGS